MDTLKSLAHKIEIKLENAGEFFSIDDFNPFTGCCHNPFTVIE